MAWVESLTSTKSWDEFRDRQRIRAAFIQMGASRRTWPSPADLVEALPRYDTQLALPEKPTDPEIAAENIAKIRRMLSGEDE